jgi:MoaA/NifB/PqqE/SkfB family radical SAM enzyme
MTTDEIKKLVKQASDLGAYNVVFTGGEPTLLNNDLIMLFRFIKNETKIQSIRMVTNAKWASTYDIAYQKLLEWKESGLDEVNFSCGEYHQQEIEIERVANAFNAAKDIQFQTVLLAGEFIKTQNSKFPPQEFYKKLGYRPISPDMRSPFCSKVVGMSKGAAMAYGRGKDFIPDDHLIKTDEFNIPTNCADVNSIITVHPNGNVTACCGVMVRENSLLTIGNWRENSLEEIVTESQRDVILSWVKYLGLSNMKEWLLQKNPNLDLPKNYTSICDLCAKIFYNPECESLLLQYAEEKQGEIIANKLAQDSTLYSKTFRYDSAQLI